MHTVGWTGWLAEGRQMRKVADSIESERAMLACSRRDEAAWRQGLYPEWISWMTADKLGSNTLRLTLESGTEIAFKCSPDTTAEAACFGPLWLFSQPPKP